MEAFPIMTTTSQSDDRDIDADQTLKLDALDEVRIAMLDVRAESRVPTRNELSFDLQATLSRLTPPAPSARPARSRTLPVRGAPGAAVRWTRARDRIAILVAAVVRAVLGQFSRFAAGGGELAASLAHVLRQLVAESFARGRRRRAAALYRVQRARWKAPPIAQARAWTRVRHLLDVRKATSRR